MRCNVWSPSCRIHTSTGPQTGSRQTEDLKDGKHSQVLARVWTTSSRKTWSDRRRLGPTEAVPLLVTWCPGQHTKTTGRHGRTAAASLSFRTALVPV
eukprot:bmy_16061T0